jgi:tetratricopeptide (TPR) repeat protein
MFKKIKQGGVAIGVITLLSSCQSYHSHYQTDQDRAVHIVPMENQSTVSQKGENKGVPNIVFEEGINDSDHDGIPDFADGLTHLPKQLKAIKNISTSEKLKLVPLKIEFKKEVFADNTTFKFNYIESNPLLISRVCINPKDKEPSYKYIAPPGFRLWIKSGASRDARSIVDGGDFIPANTALTAKNLNLKGDTLTLYLEATPKAYTLNKKYLDIHVEPIKKEPKGILSTDWTQLTPIQFSFVTKGENGDIVPTEFIGCSTPRPAIVLKEITFDDIKIEGNDIIIPIGGHVLDPMADNFPAGIGEIKHVWIKKNNNKPQKESLDITHSKGNSFWKQYPYSGEFGPLLIKIPLKEGVQQISIETDKNAADLTGVYTLGIEANKIGKKWVVKIVDKYSNEKGSYMPFTLQVKGLGDDYKEYIAVLDNSKHELVKYGNAYYPGEEGSPSIHVVVKSTSNKMRLTFNSTATAKEKKELATMNTLLEQYSKLLQTKNQKEAVAYILQKAHDGSPAAAFVLSIFYRQGVGVAKDSKKSEMWLVNAAKMGHINAQNSIAYRWAVKGVNLDKALHFINMALSETPNDGAFLDTKGLIYYKKKEYKNALKFFLLANKFSPNIAEHEEHLGDTYSKLKQWKDAVNNWKKALSHTKNESDQTQLKKKIETTKKANETL